MLFLKGFSNNIPGTRTGVPNLCLVPLVGAALMAGIEALTFKKELED